MLWIGHLFRPCVGPTSSRHSLGVFRKPLGRSRKLGERLLDLACSEAR